MFVRYSVSSIAVQPFTLTFLEAYFYNIHTYLIVPKGETTYQKPSQAPGCTSVRNRRHTATLVPAFLIGMSVSEPRLVELLDEMLFCTVRPAARLLLCIFLCHAWIQNVSQ